MATLDTSVEARISKGGKHFVILVDCDLALSYRQGAGVALSDVIISDVIYSDVKKGFRAAEADLKTAFGSDDFSHVADAILKKGEIVLTAEHQRRVVEQRRKQIIDIIVRNSINPQTNTPHPAPRIADALVAAKVRVDLHKSADAQVQDIVKKVSTILPIRFEVRELQIQIPVTYAQQTFHTFKKFGALQKQEWLPDGSLFVVIKLPAGQQEALEVALGQVCKGDYSLKVIRS